LNALVRSTGIVTRALPGSVPLPMYARPKDGTFAITTAMAPLVCIWYARLMSLSAKSLENPKVLDQTVSDIMDAPFPVVDSAHAVDAIVKLLSKSNPAVLVQEHGRIQGIVTRSDMLSFMMAR
jgi:CBS domain-containing protein